MNVVDDYTRECIGQLVETSISGTRVVRFLNQLIEVHGKPTQNAFVESFNGKFRDSCLNHGS